MVLLVDELENSLQAHLDVRSLHRRRGHLQVLDCMGESGWELLAGIETFSFFVPIPSPRPPHLPSCMSRRLLRVVLPVAWDGHQPETSQGCVNAKRRLFLDRKSCGCSCVLWAEATVTDTVVYV